VVTYPVYGTISYYPVVVKTDATTLWTVHGKMLKKIDLASGTVVHDLDLGDVRADLDEAAAPLGLVPVRLRGRLLLRPRLDRVDGPAVAASGEQERGQEDEGSGHVSPLKRWEPGSPQPGCGTP